MDNNTHPRPPSNAYYLFRSTRTAIAWALVGLLVAVLFWTAMIGWWLWVTR